MTFLFWGLTIAMVLAAIAVVAIPLKGEKSGRRLPGVIVAIIVPVIALGLYSVLGSPDDVTADGQGAHRNQFQGTNSSGGQNGTSVGSVGSLVDGLRSRLQQKPEDAGGWLLLAHSYEHLGRYEDARDAYEHAKSLGKADSDLQ